MPSPVNGRCSRYLFCLIVLVSAAQTAGAADFASVVPADALFYATLSEPAEFWKQFQETELRRAIKDSFLAEAALNFFSATTDLFSKSLFDSPLDLAVYTYGLDAGFAVCPHSSPGEHDLPIAYILSVSKHGPRFRTLLRQRLDDVFFERFPSIVIKIEQIAGFEVRHYVFSEKKTWTMTVVDDFVIFGKPTAVSWILQTRPVLADEPAFVEIRQAARPPKRPHLFCYATATGAAAETSLLLDRGAAIAGVMEFDGSLIRDRVLISGNVKTHFAGEPVSCSIGDLFPPGPYAVTQISLSSGRPVAKLMNLDGLDARHAQTFDRTFTGLAYLASDGSTQPASEIIVAKLTAGVDPGRALSVFGLERRGNEWRGGTRRAFIRDGHLYLGPTDALDTLQKRLSSRSGSLAERPHYTANFAAMPLKARAYSYMSPAYVKSLSWFEKIARYSGVFDRLPAAWAVVEKTPYGYEIRSVSAHGYAIRIAASSAEAAKRIKDIERELQKEQEARESEPLIDTNRH